MENQNGLLYLATGKSRKERHWKNKEWSWPDLVARLSETHYTAETHAEYMAASKSRQDEIKDTGGYVGGYLAGGKRNKSSVLHRQLLTLDADNNPHNLWDDFTMLYDCAAVTYSTHKHTPKNPRLRLIIPLDREVTPDEYEAIARKVAGSLDIEIFDPTTFQPSRLMYWPSTSKDAEYYFRHQEAGWLSADSILKTYHNWQDASEWPVGSKHQEVIHRAMAKQGDPLEKPGVVGAFCRAYTIQEAIEKFLPDVYSADGDRYSFTGGSTSGGLVIYYDKFAYSHHGTDPAGSKLCNAFDLVRIHLYGLKDEESTAQGNKLPSYVAMCDTATKDKTVRKIIGEEKIKEAFSDFEVPEEEGTTWMEHLEVDRKGNAYKTINNAVLILENSPVFKGYFAYDDFQKTEVAIKDLPWRKIDRFSRRTNDEDAAYLRMHLETPWGITGKEKIDDAFTIVTQKNKIHPVKDYLENCKWDGEERLDTLFIEFMGVEDSEYTRAVTRKTLVAAVQRIYEPGCKFDYLLTLIGPQGTKKSSIINKLGRGWVNESFNFSQLHNGGKEANEQIQGFWIIEIPEMSGFDRADMNQVKNFTARQVDNYRVAYGRKTQEFPRQCIFIGSGNNHEFLIDPTGNRRYWVLNIQTAAATKNIDTQLDDAYISQVWAEARYRYSKGENLFLDAELEKAAKSMQEEHTQEHPWKAEIETYLDTLLPDNWGLMTKEQRYQFIAYPDELQTKGTRCRDRVCLQEVWVEGLQQRANKKINRTDAGIITDVMNNMPGWERAQRIRYGAYGLQRRGWVRTENTIDAQKRIEKNDEENELF